MDALQEEEDPDDDDENVEDVREEKSLLDFDEAEDGSSERVKANAAIELTLSVSLRYQASLTAKWYSITREELQELVVYSLSLDNVTNWPLARALARAFSEPAIMLCFANVTVTSSKRFVAANWITTWKYIAKVLLDVDFGRKSPSSKDPQYEWPWTLEHVYQYLSGDYSFMDDQTILPNGPFR
jgi:hypothetical protein